MTTQEKLKEIEQQIRKDIPRCHEVKLNDVLEWITQFYPHLVLKIESNRVFSKEEGYSINLLIETKYSKIECNLSGELLKYHPKEFIDFLYDLIPKK